MNKRDEPGNLRIAQSTGTAGTAGRATRGRDGTTEMQDTGGSIRAKRLGAEGNEEIHLGTQADTTAALQTSRKVFKDRRVASRRDAVMQFGRGDSAKGRTHNDRQVGNHSGTAKAVLGK